LNLDKLKNYELKFCKIRRGEKIPVETEWQNKGYTYEQIKGWVAQGNNYGILCGVAGLIVIDADNPKLMKFMEEECNLPKTFTVKTGKGMHYYYFCPEMKKKIVLTTTERFGEIQCWGTQVVGPDSLHPSGVYYTVVQDLPIKIISLEEVLFELRDFIPPKKIEWEEVKGSNKNKEELSQADINNIQITDVIRLNKSRRLANGEIIGENPWHGCTGQGNFSINPNKNVAHCFRCDKGMNVAQVIAREFGIISECGGVLSKEEFKKVLEVAYTNFKLPKPQPKNKLQQQATTKTKKGEEEDPNTYTSSLVFEDCLVEEIVVESKAKFIVFERANNNIKMVDSFERDGIPYKPIQGEEISKGVVGLPDSVAEFGNTKELMAELQIFVRKWLDADEKHLKFAIYNILRSWVFQRFYTLNYLRALGDYGSGKSRYLDVIGLLHYKPIATSGAITSAVLYRLMEKWHGTLIIDEADRRQSDEADEVIKIINQGYEKNRNVIRCDKERNYELKFFDPFGPKVLATRREFEDKATESRCLTLVMKPTPRHDIPPNLTDEFFKEVQALRNKLLLWRFKNFYSINPDFGATIKLDYLEPRLRQVSVGFFSMFEHEPEEIENFKTFLVGMQAEIISQRGDTMEGKIVVAIAELVIERFEAQGFLKITPETLASINITPQMIIQKAELYGRDGKLISSNKLANFMKSLGIKKSEVVRTGMSTIRSYPLESEHLDMLFRKYISDDELQTKLDNFHFTKLFS